MAFVSESLVVVTNSVGKPLNATVQRGAAPCTLPTIATNSPASGDYQSVKTDSYGALQVWHRFLSLDNVDGFVNALRTYDSVSTIRTEVDIYFGISGVVGIEVFGFRDGNNQPKSFLIGSRSSIREYFDLEVQVSDMTVNTWYMISRFMLGDKSWTLRVQTTGQYQYLSLMRDDSNTVSTSRIQLIRSGDIVGLVAAYLPFSLGIQDQINIVYTDVEGMIEDAVEEAQAQFLASANDNFVSV